MSLGHLKKLVSDGLIGLKAATYIN